MSTTVQSGSQYVFGPAPSPNSDTLHLLNGSGVITSWVDNNAQLQGAASAQMSAAAVAVLAGAINVNNANGPAVAITVSAAGAYPALNAAGAQVALNLPGNSTFDQVPFRVYAAGYYSTAAGTYTATIQPLLYASTTPGFTAAVGNAIFSAAAVTLAVTAASASTIPFQLEAHLVAAVAAPVMYGWTIGTLPTTTSGANLAAPVNSAALAIVNPPTVTMTAAIPVQFSFGITVAGTAAAGSTYSLGTFRIES